MIVVQALPTTAIGKIHKPTLGLQQLEAVVREEAQATGVLLERCEAVQDPALGSAVKWKSRGDGQALRERLSDYTFRSIQQT